MITLFEQYQRICTATGNSVELKGGGLDRQREARVVNSTEWSFERDSLKLEGQHVSKQNDM